MAGAQDLEQVPHLVGGRKPCRPFGDLSADGRRLAALEGGDPRGEPHGGEEARLVDQGINRGAGLPQALSEAREIDMGGDVGLARMV